MSQADNWVLAYFGASNIVQWIKNTFLFTDISVYTNSFKNSKLQVYLQIYVNI